MHITKPTEIKPISTIHMRIQSLLEETNEAFESCAGSMNTDYAAFASMRLSEFKMLLGKPDMTGQELRRILRRGNAKQRLGDPDDNWSAFIAGYITQKTNENAEFAFQNNVFQETFQET